MCVSFFQKVVGRRKDRRIPRSLDMTSPDAMTSAAAATASQAANDDVKDGDDAG